MEFEVRPIAPEEFPTFVRTNYAAFGGVPADDDVERARGEHDQERGLAAFDAGRMVGTTTAFAFDLTVPGGAMLPVAAVSWVG
ncbi:MAG: GNAT family N-acetyltransferase, partial [Ktedonobacterales bacterium]